MWLYSSWNDFTESILVYLQLTERDYLQSTPLGKLCTYPNDAATVGNTSGYPVVK
jgi:hypothetical protein